MGKVSPKNSKQRKAARGGGKKYLKPGALAQLKYSKASSAKAACTDLGRKRVAVAVEVEVKKRDHEVVLAGIEDRGGALMLSPVGSLLRTPRTPRMEDCESELRLDSLPMDLLVKLLCHLHHDQLKPVFHVSQRIRTAVIFARQYHFNCTTPDRSRQEMLRTMTPHPTEVWPFKSKRDDKGTWIRSPHTPKAPRHDPRPPSRLKVSEMRQVAAVLFQESNFPSRCMVPSVLPKPLCKSLASNRVLFYEDELCQAVAQNKLL